MKSLDSDSFSGKFCKQGENTSILLKTLAENWKGENISLITMRSQHCPDIKIRQKN